MALRNIQSGTSYYLVSPPDEADEFKKNARVGNFQDRYIAPNSEENNPGRKIARSEILTWSRQARLVAETRQFDIEFARVKKHIEERQPWPYSRFTDALEAGLNCMPMGATYEA